MDIALIRSGLGIIAGVLGVFALFPYLRDIFKGVTRPNIVSWAGWTLLTGIATAAQFAEGASWSVVVPLSSTIGTGVIALFAFRFGYTAFNTTDKICFFLGGTAILLWVFTGEPLLALVLSVLADFIVGFPTMLKAYQEPQSETVSTWAIFTGAAVLGMLASDNFSFHNMLFPAYLFFFDGTVTLLIIRKVFKGKNIG